MTPKMQDSVDRFIEASLPLFPGWTPRPRA